MANTRGNITSQFAQWIAMSSARQGCSVRGRKWYPFIKKIKIDDLLLRKKTSDSFFEKWHKEQVETLARNAKVPIGWAAKIVNMITKVRVYVAHEGNPSLLSLIHPPIDNNLMKNIRKHYPSKKHPEFNNPYVLGKTISGIRSYEDYLKIIKCLRTIAKLENFTLFEVESFWEPE